MRQPMFFGPADRPLYGVYHPPPARGRASAALLLDPWGWEAMRAHRSLVTLSDRLAAAGCAALRFDYSSTGDSWGEREGASLEVWLSDIDWALDELLGLASSRRVTLVGLRLGGLLASLVAARRERDIDRLVLWDPPDSGRTFLRWWDRAPKHEARAFPVPRAFVEEVEATDLAGVGAFRGHVMVVASDPTRVVTDRARSREDVDTNDAPECWVEDHHRGAGRLPVGLVSRIVEWVSP